MGKRKGREEEMRVVVEGVVVVGVVGEGGVEDWVGGGEGEWGC